MGGGSDGQPSSYLQQFSPSHARHPGIVCCLPQVLHGVDLRHKLIILNVLSLQVKPDLFTFKPAIEKPCPSQFLGSRLSSAPMPA